MFSVLLYLYLNLSTCLAVKVKHNYKYEYECLSMLYLEFNKALELEPNDYLSWYSLGKSWLELEDNKKAIECFDKSLEINEDFVLARLAKMENKQKM